MTSDHTTPPQDDPEGTTITVEIFSDVVCPWCYIGKRRFEKALDAFRAAHPTAGVDVRFRAFQLDPTAPAGVSQPVQEAYARKFGGPEAAQQIIERVSGEAAKEGLDFRMDRALRANTLLAHQLLALAEERGVQDAMKERLLAAYFTDGLAIGDPDVLVDLAVGVGLDANEARRWLDGSMGRQHVADDLEFALDNGITSVPTYVFDGRLAVPGAQEPDLFLKVLERTLELAAAG
ncbi:MAG: DsbA family oxidoreductase [Acidimicrobiia bacterium]|nr:DsbA family oxidoreductase [Acidimicrobiia bacterium]MDH4363260.1 DsbA family oxidoreductase [Acidimicrobiia bacterium]MDH5290900.1 DsbA family oxidoreductase [Acidimicrobiia bacterium]